MTMSALTWLCLGVILLLGLCGIGYYFASKALKLELEAEDILMEWDAAYIERMKNKEN